MKRISKDKYYVNIAQSVSSRSTCLKRQYGCVIVKDDEIIATSKASKAAGADFVKTSTGFSKGGATVEAVKLMREAVGPDMGVKASGGIHSRQEMLAMIEAGATRIGASCGVELMKE